MMAETRPAPFNPDTIERIRVMAREGKTEAAIAQELRWDIPFVRSVARTQRIDVAPSITKSAAAAAPEDVVFDGIRWSRLACEVERAGRVVALSRLQSRIFGVLLMHLQSGGAEFLSATQIATRLQTTVEGMTMVSLRGKLGGLHILLQSRTRADGGYRLLVKPWPVKPLLPAPSEPMA